MIGLGRRMTVGIYLVNETRIERDVIEVAFILVRSIFVTNDRHRMYLDTAGSRPSRQSEGRNYRDSAREVL